MLHGVPLLRAAGMSPRRRAVRSRPHSDLRHGVAILGTRGVPANYGGFETFAERLALHLVESGVPVTVYCRSHYATEPSPWRGVRLVSLPTIKSKYFDTVVHTFLSALHLVFTSRIRDVVLCNAANAPVLPLLRLTGGRVIMNVDGLEWRRGKWGVAGRVVVPDGGVAVGALRVGARHRRRRGADVLPRAPRQRLGDGAVRRGLAAARSAPSRPRRDDAARPGRLRVVRVPLGAGEQPTARRRGAPGLGRRAAAGHARQGDVRRRARPCGPRRSRADGSSPRPGVRRRLPGAAGQRPVLHARDRGRRHAPGAHRGARRRQPLPRPGHPGEPRGRRGGRVVLRRCG